MSVITNNLLLGEDGYNISRSVRLRSSASAYFNRTPASASNRKTWTWSGWSKRGGLPSSGYYSFFGADSGSGQSFYIAFDNSTQQLELGQGATVNRKTTQVFRDPSAWYHIVIASDTTQATGSNRLKIYVNGNQVTTFATSNDPSLNGDWAVNNNVAHSIGADITNTGARNYIDGYLTEVNFIDGQALTPSSFGETDSITGVWKPKKYAGTYGTNGFYLNFSDPSSTTTIGYDYSGNSNNWTPNNISVTSGVTYDSMLDVPTMWADGGNGRGNYCTLNPLAFFATGASASNGNLRLTVTSSGGNLRPTIGATSGKYYAEFTITDIGGNSGTSFSIQTAGPSLQGSAIINALYYVNGQTYNYATASFTSYGASYTTGDVIGVAWDIDDKQVTFYKNNTSQGTLAGSAITPSNATEPVVAFAATSGGTGTTIVDANFGQRPFVYTPPTGFKALNTQNLPDATIKKGNAYFDATLWTGDNSSPRAITNSGSMQPDLVWVKRRNGAADHALFDAVRGFGGNKDLSSNTTGAEGALNTSLYGNVSAANSTGFQLTAGSTDSSYTNRTGDTYVGWQWKESASAGFDIVTYTGTGANRTVAHSLGVAPSLIILKQRSAVDFWVAWHSSIANTEYLLLNSTNAKATAATYWNSTSPTSSVFSLGTDSRPNGSGVTYVAYLFAEVAGYSKFGSYTGNGSTDGAFVYLGFRPRYVLVKRSDSTGDWNLHDTARDSYNVADKSLFPNVSNAEATPYYMDIVSNGFKIRDSGSSMNTSSGTYIFAAFAENPFKNSLAR